MSLWDDAKASSAFFPSDTEEVKDNDDLRRIVNLPRREISQSWCEQLAEEITPLLARPYGRQKLRPIQALALFEIGTYGGLFGAITVGKGKTLIAALTSSVVDDHIKRILMIIPAGLVEKTERDLTILHRHWYINPVKTMTYQWLGRMQAAEALNKYKPQLFICDECHFLKNPDAAVTRRVARYFKEHPDTQMVAMSGTITKRSILDYAHIIQWCLGKRNAPIPLSFVDRELWSDALDERKSQQKRAKPGALIELCNDEEKRQWLEFGEPRTAARLAFKRRLYDTPGVIHTQETSVDASLMIESVSPPKSKPIEDAFTKLRKDWETPDDWPLMDGLEVYRHAWEIALGLYYVWDPRPPLYWMQARKEWCAVVRKIVRKESNTYDSAGMVKRAMLDDEDEEMPLADELVEWLKVENDFTPNSVPRWLDNTVIDLVATWLHNNNGIVWVDHVWFAEKLSRVSGITYYGQKGLSKSGRSVEVHPDGAPMILSRNSNSTGRNLQAWCQNFVLAPPPNALQWEQMIGRTHRDLQLADTVFFFMSAFCVEHVAAFWQAMRDAEFTLTTTGMPQKLLIADVNVPTADDLIMRQRNGRWHK